MKKRTTHPVLFLLVPAVGLLLWGIFIIWSDFDKGDSFEPGPHLENGAEAEKAPIVIKDISGPATEADAAHTLEEGAAPDSGEVPSAKALIKPTGIPLAGRVTDRETGMPVPAFDFKLHKQVDNNWVQVIHDTVRNEEGRFAFMLEDGGERYLTIRSSKHLLHRERNLMVPPEEGVKNLEIQLGTGAGLTGVVKDALTGQPVKGAVVAALPAEEYYSTTTFRYQLEMILRGYTEYTVHDRTDEQGVFTLRGLTRLRQNLFAFHPDFAPGLTDAYPGRGEGVEILLDKGHSVYGKALDDRGRPVKGLLVFPSQSRKIYCKHRQSGKSRVIRRNLSVSAFPAITGPDGRYRTFPLLPGKVTITAGPPSDEEAEGYHFTGETRYAEIVDRDVVVNLGPQPGHVSWSGAVLDYAGVPLADASIQVRLDKVVDPSYGKLGRSTTSDPSGRFEMKKLLQGTYKVTLTVPGMISRIDWGKLALDRSGRVDRDLQIKGAAIRGLVISEVTDEPLGGSGYRADARTRSTSGRWIGFTSNVAEDGSFCLQGMPAGVYRLMVTGPARAKKTISNLFLETDQVLEDMRIYFPGMGSLKVLLSGFESTISRKLSVQVRRLDNNQKGYFYTNKQRNDGVRERVAKLEYGTWNVEIRSKNHGTVTRTVHINPDQETELWIYRNDLY